MPITTEMERDALTDSELDKLHRQQNQEFLTEHKAFYLTPDYWKLSEQQRMDWVRRPKLSEQEKQIDKVRRLAMERSDVSAMPKRTRKTTTPVAKALPVAPPKKTTPKDQGGKENLCRKCGDVIPPTGKRGRPAAFHDGCRPAK